MILERPKHRKAVHTSSGQVHPAEGRVDLRFLALRAIGLPTCGYEDRPDERSHRSHRLTTRIPARS
jgi:hypothetical protein